MRRLLALAAASAAAFAAPASAGPTVCTPSVGDTTVGGCVHVVCLKLCVTQIEVDPQCSLDRPVPMPVAAACSRVDAQYVVIGG